MHATVVALDGCRADGSVAPDVSVLMPCLNEAATVVQCVVSARRVLDDQGLLGEVVVVDNASDDRSGELAAQAGARVLREPRRGYGSAYQTGLAAARGRHIVMADADLTYDFAEIPRFVAELERGADLVIGDRMDNIDPGAMPWLHRYVGNPVLSGLLNAFFRTGVRDAHCGMRALRRSAIGDLDLQSTGMEFASEMVIRAAKQKLTVRQLPIRYHRRGGESKLSSVRDGWRHLRLLLVHSPTYLFVAPGLAMALLGALIEFVVLASVDVLGRRWQAHAMIAGGLLTIVGTQVLAFGCCARAYGAYFLGERDRWFARLRSRLRLGHGLGLGAGFLTVGLGLLSVIGATWLDHGFGALSAERLAILAATLVTVGVQVFSASFLLSILGLRRER